MSDKKKIMDPFFDADPVEELALQKSLGFGDVLGNFISGVGSNFNTAIGSAERQYKQYDILNPSIDTTEEEYQRRQLEQMALEREITNERMKGYEARKALEDSGHNILARGTTLGGSLPGVAINLGATGLSALASSNPATAPLAPVIRGAGVAASSFFDAYSAAGEAADLVREAGGSEDLAYNAYANALPKQLLTTAPDAFADYLLYGKIGLAITNTNKFKQFAKSPIGKLGKEISDPASFIGTGVAEATRKPWAGMVAGGLTDVGGQLITEGGQETGQNYISNIEANRALGKGDQEYSLQGYADYVASPEGIETLKDTAISTLMLGGPISALGARLNLKKGWNDSNATNTVKNNVEANWNKIKDDITEEGLNGMKEDMSNAFGEDYSNYSPIDLAREYVAKMNEADNDFSQEHSEKMLNEYALRVTGESEIRNDVTTDKSLKWLSNANLDQFNKNKPNEETLNTETTESVENANGVIDEVNTEQNEKNKDVAMTIKNVSQYTAQSGDINSTKPFSDTVRERGTTEPNKKITSSPFFQYLKNNYDVVKTQREGVRDVVLNLGGLNVMVTQNQDRSFTVTEEGSQEGLNFSFENEVLDNLNRRLSENMSKNTRNMEGTVHNEDGDISEKDNPEKSGKTEDLKSNRLVGSVGTFWKWFNEDIRGTELEKELGGVRGAFELAKILRAKKFDQSNVVFDFRLGQKKLAENGGRVYGGTTFGVRPGLSISEEAQILRLTGVQSAIIQLYNGADIVTAVHELFHVGFWNMNDTQRRAFYIWAPKTQNEFAERILRIKVLNEQARREKLRDSAKTEEERQKYAEIPNEIIKRVMDKDTNIDVYSYLNEIKAQDQELYKEIMGDGSFGQTFELLKYQNVNIEKLMGQDGRLPDDLQRAMEERFAWEGSLYYAEQFSRGIRPRNIIEQIFYQLCSSLSTALGLVNDFSQRLNQETEITMEGRKINYNPMNDFSSMSIINNRNNQQQQQTELTAARMEEQQPVYDTTLENQETLGQLGEEFNDRREGGVQNPTMGIMVGQPYSTEGVLQENDFGLGNRNLNTLTNAELTRIAQRVFSEASPNSSIFQEILQELERRGMTDFNQREVGPYTGGENQGTFKESRTPEPYFDFNSDLNALVMAERLVDQYNGNERDIKDALKQGYNTALTLEQRNFVTNVSRRVVAYLGAKKGATVKTKDGFVSGTKELQTKQLPQQSGLTNEEKRRITVPWDTTNFAQPRGVKRVSDTTAREIYERASEGDENAQRIFTTKIPVDQQKEVIQEYEEKQRLKEEERKRLEEQLKKEEKEKQKQLEKPKETELPKEQPKQEEKPKEAEKPKETKKKVSKENTKEFVLDKFKDKYKSLNDEQKQNFLDEIDDGKQYANNLFNTIKEGILRAIENGKKYKSLTSKDIEDRKIEYGIKAFTRDNNSNGFTAEEENAQILFIKAIVDKKDKNYIKALLNKISYGKRNSDLAYDVAYLNELENELTKLYKEGNEFQKPSDEFLKKLTDLWYKTLTKDLLKGQEEKKQKRTTKRETEKLAKQQEEELKKKQQEEERKKKEQEEKRKKELEELARQREKEQKERQGNLTDKEYLEYDNLSKKIELFKKQKKGEFTNEDLIRWTELSDIKDGTILDSNGNKIEGNTRLMKGSVTDEKEIKQLNTVYKDIFFNIGKKKGYSVKRIDDSFHTIENLNKALTNNKYSNSLYINPKDARLLVERIKDFLTLNHETNEEIWKKRKDKNNKLLYGKNVYRGLDGKWKYELSDKDAKLDINKLSDELMNNFSLDGSEFKLGDIVKHDELFKLFPKLKDIPVKFISKEMVDNKEVHGVNNTDFSAAYSYGDKVIYINTDVFFGTESGTFSPIDVFEKIESGEKEQINEAIDEIRDAMNEMFPFLLHETQHAIQDIENNMSNGSKRVLAFILHADTKGLFQYIKNTGNQQEIALAQRTLNDVTKTQNFLQKLLKNKTEKGLQNIIDNYMEENYYYSNLDEIEAYDTQNRFNRQNEDALPLTQAKFDGHDAYNDALRGEGSIVRYMEGYSNGENFPFKDKKSLAEIEKIYKRDFYFIGSRMGLNNKEIDNAYNKKKELSDINKYFIKLELNEDKNLKNFVDINDIIKATWWGRGLKDKEDGKNSIYTRGIYVDLYGDWVYTIDHSNAKWIEEGVKDVANKSFGKIIFNSHKSVKLGNILDFPEIFKAYPFLKDIPVKFLKSGSVIKWISNAHYNSEKNEIVINLDRFNDFDGKELRVLLHEIQHAIQYKEGRLYSGFEAYRQAIKLNKKDFIDGINTLYNIGLISEQSKEIMINEFNNLINDPDKFNSLFFKLSKNSKRYNFMGFYHNPKLTNKENMIFVNEFRKVENNRKINEYLERNIDSNYNKRYIEMVASDINLLDRKDKTVDYKSGEKYGMPYYNEKTTPPLLGRTTYIKGKEGTTAIYRFQKGEKLTPQERVEVSRQILNRAFPNVRFQYAWHSTPHDFDAFTLDHLLKGEGAMAHGWGLYFAKSLPKNYKNYFKKFHWEEFYLSPQERYEVLLNGKDFTEKFFELITPEHGMSYEIKSELETLNNKNIKDFIRKKFKERLVEMEKIVKNQEDFINKKKKEGKDTITQEGWLKDNKDYILKQKEIFLQTMSSNININDKGNKTRFILANIPDDDVLIRKGAKFKDQPQKVLKALIKLFKDIDKIEGRKVENYTEEKIIEKLNWAIYEMTDELVLNNVFDYNKLSDAIYCWFFPTDYGIFSALDANKEVFSDIKLIDPSNKYELTSKILNKYGVKGISYNGRQDGECVVVFDNKAIDIINKFKKEESKWISEKPQAKKQELTDTQKQRVERKLQEKKQKEEKTTKNNTRYQLHSEEGMTKTDINTPEFKNWFKGSILKNKDGSPKVFYRGIKNHYDPTYDKEEGGAVWITESKEQAEAFRDTNEYEEVVKQTGKKEKLSYHEPMSNVETGDLAEVYANVQKPFNVGQIMDEGSNHEHYMHINNVLQRDVKNGKITEAQRRQVLEDLSYLNKLNKKGEYPQTEHALSHHFPNKKFFNALKKAGYDSIQGYENDIMTYGIFDKGNVKSIYNEGTWDRTNKNMRYMAASQENLTEEEKAERKHAYHQKRANAEARKQEKEKKINNAVNNGNIARIHHKVYSVSFDKSSQNNARNKQLIDYFDSENGLWEKINNKQDGSITFIRKNPQSHHTKIWSYSGINGLKIKDKPKTKFQEWRKWFKDFVIKKLINDKYSLYQLATKLGVEKAYKKLIVYAGQGLVANDAMEHGITYTKNGKTFKSKGLNQIIRDVGEERQTSFNDYAIAYRIIDLADRIEYSKNAQYWKDEKGNMVRDKEKRPILIKDKDGNIVYDVKAELKQLTQKMSVEEARDTIAQVQNDKSIAKLFEDNRKSLVEYCNALLQATLLDSGIINQEQYDRILQAEPNFVPLAKVEEDEDCGLMSMNRASGLVNTQNPLHKIESSVREVANPLGEMLKRTAIYYSIAAKNKAGRTFITEIANKVDTLANGDKIARAQGIVREVVVKPDEEKLITQPDNKEQIIYVYENGEKKFYQVSDKDIFTALHSLDEKQWNTIGKILDAIGHKPAALVRATATSTPDFGLRNVVRDTFEAWLTSEHGFAPLLDSFWGMYQYWNNTEWALEYHEMIGEYGTMNRENVDGVVKVGDIVNDKFNPYKNTKDFVQKQWKIFNDAGKNKQERVMALGKIMANAEVVGKKTWAGGKIILSPFVGVYKMNKKFNDMFEQGTRIAEYRNARMGYTGFFDRMSKGGFFNTNLKDAKESKIEAAYAAKDITLNFEQHGEWGKYINRYIPFFNASMQGIYKMCNAIELATRGIDAQNRKNTDLRNAMRIKVAFMVACAVGIAAAGQGDEDYDEAPEWEKENFWILSDGIRIPRDQVFGRLIGYTVERAVDQALKGKFEPTELGWNIIKNFTMEKCVPTLLDMGIGYYGNYDTFRKRSITPEYMAEKLGYLQSDISTSNFARNLSEAMYDVLGVDVGAKKIDWVMRMHISNMAKYANSLFDLGYKAYNPETFNEKMTRGYDKNDATGAFVGGLKDSVPPILNNITGTFATNRTVYNSISDFQERYHDLKVMSSDESKMTRELKREWKRYQDAYKKFMKYLKDLKSIKQNNKLSGAEKREKADKIFQQQIKIAKWAEQ